MLATLTLPQGWTGDPALIWVLCAALLFWRGGRGRRRRRGEGWRTAAFVAGLAAIVIAIGSPIDKLADELFWVHMVQHILLIAVAPPLLALARPWSRMWRGFPVAFRRSVAREVSGGRAWAPARRVAAIAAGGVASWLIFNLNFCAWHLPFLYDAALRSPPVHALEHLIFFATALLFWTRVVYSPPWRSPLGEMAKLAYLGSTMVVGWVLAIVLAMASSPIYSAYADEASRPGHISAFTDQQLAAGVMWVPGSISYTIAIVVIAYRWLEPADSRRRSGVAARALPKGVG